MNKRLYKIAFIIIFTLFITNYKIVYGAEDKILLPAPKLDSNVSIEKSLKIRRSVRRYKNKPLELKDISQLLWAAQGITSRLGFRTAPSAGALYPIEVYAIVGNVHGLPNGVYKYKPQKHELIRVMNGDKRIELCNAALKQYSIKNAPLVFVITGVYERTMKKYGRRGIRYVHIEAGNVSQNIYLQSVSLNLGTVLIGAFDDNKIKKVLNMKDNEQPLCIMPIGRK